MAKHRVPKGADDEGMELAPTNNGEFMPSVPDGETGTENMADDGFVLPRIKLAQGQTQDKPESVKVGDFFNTLTGESLGNKILIVPLYFWNSRIFFDDDFNVKCRSFKGAVPDVGKLAPICAECKYSKWGEEDEKPECMFTYNYAVLTQEQLAVFEKGGFELPSILNGHGSQIAQFKRMNSIIKAKALGANKIPMYGQKYMVTTKLQKFDKGQAFVVEVVFHSYVSEKEFAITREMYAKLKTQDLKGPIKDDSDKEGKTGKKQQNL